MDQNARPIVGVPVEITGYSQDRILEKIGNELIPGDTVQKLVVKFPNGKKHLVPVSSDAFDDYLEALGMRGALPSNDPPSAA